MTARRKHLLYIGDMRAKYTAVVRLSSDEYTRYIVTHLVRSLFTCNEDTRTTLGYLNSTANTLLTFKRENRRSRRGKCRSFDSCQSSFSDPSYFPSYLGCYGLVGDVGKIELPTVRATPRWPARVRFSGPIQQDVRVIHVVHSAFGIAILVGRYRQGEPEKPDDKIKISVRVAGINANVGGSGKMVDMIRRKMASIDPIKCQVQEEIILTRNQKRL